MNSSSYLRVLPIITQNSFTGSPTRTNASLAVCKHCSGTVTCLEAVAPRCPIKKVFLSMSQNSLENICARASFLIVCLKSFIIAKQK